jgi:hypothetical protein
MMLKDEQIKLLMLLYEVEKVLGDIYVVFSEQFPSHNDLWEVLIREEHGHAEAVRELYKLCYEGKSVVSEAAFNPQAVQSIIDYSKDILQNAKKKKYPIDKALSITYDLERSLVEKDVFKHFKVAPEYKDRLMVLHTETQRHIAMLEDRLANTK